MDERVWSVPPDSWIVQLLQVYSVLKEGRFVRVAGLTVSGRDLCFMGLLVKLYAGGKLEQCCGFLGPGMQGCRTHGSSGLTHHLHSSPHVKLEGCSILQLRLCLQRGRDWTLRVFME